MTNISKNNSRTFFLGLGGSDAKTNVATLTELENLIIDLSEFYQDDDIVWVVGQKAFYTVQKAESPPYELFTTGDTIISNVEAISNIYYGKELDILAFLQGDQSKLPSTLGYSDGDGFISSREVSAGSRIIKKFDVYEAYVPVTPTGIDPEAYVLIGSMQGSDGSDGAVGNDGSQGAQGAQGAQGDAFTVDQQGLVADRDIDCDTRPVGWSFLATDEGLLYFKEAVTGGEPPCNWSVGIPFGKGDPGETTYSVFRRALESNPPQAPTTGTLHPATAENWFDAPPVTTDPDQRLWSSKTRYSSATPQGNIIWSQAVMVDGERGLDGTEGVDGSGAGFWVVWSDLQNPSLSISVKPVIDGGGIYSLDLSGDTDWYDDVDLNDVPQWMAQITYSPNTNAWDVWQFIKIAGEQPPYKLSLYKRLATVPAAPTTTLEYINSGTDTFTTGAEAAILVGDDWLEIPSAGAEKLYLTEIALSRDGANNVWSPPVQIDGDEGRQAGVWIIWSSNDIGDRPPDPTDANIIDQGTTIDLSNDPAWKDDVAQLPGDAIWSATSYYRPDSSTTSIWTPWNIAQIKGADGLDSSEQIEYIAVQVVGFDNKVPTNNNFRTYNTIQDAIEGVTIKDNELDKIATIYHDGGIGTGTPPPTVGNRLFATADDSTPLIHGTEKYLTLTFFNNTSGFDEVVNYAKINESGFITAIYSPTEALASIPSPIIGYTDAQIVNWDHTTSTVVVDTDGREPLFVTLTLLCIVNYNVPYRLYLAGTRITLPFQVNSHDNKIRGCQVSWLYTAGSNSPSTSFGVSCSGIKIQNGASNGTNLPQGTQGQWLDVGEYGNFQMWLRVFY